MKCYRSCLNTFLLFPFALAFLLGVNQSAIGNEETPTEAAFQKLHESEQKKYAQLAESYLMALKDQPDNPVLWLQAGDARFFAGDSAGALAAYDECLRISPARYASFWQRGLVLHSLGKWKDGALQFEAYHEQISQSDRENGLWQFLCNREQFDEKTAIQKRIRYEKTDRQPFPLVYRYYEGEVTLEQVKEQFAKASLSKNEQQSTDFYLPLYVALLMDARGQKDKARALYDDALQSTWAREAGYGPHYMWQIARLQRARLPKNTK
ncbi:hypothetical protein [Planctopirus hydrillae]|uniref:Uncharacterized protein n=1 Tax=Planctopirus hydrillae TaxID=1841610 RepID=A0A1C3E7V8_9PLAN|nr:hypothetical protein [Planctopirus hydrillae]ODA29304.1 hypothetical protein A6X21_09440 [Planctopirus hydrillae]